MILTDRQDRLARVVETIERLRGRDLSALAVAEAVDVDGLERAVGGWLDALEASSTATAGAVE